jgi:hypothetical protein
MSIEWLTVVVAVVLAFLVYFLYLGIRIALSGRDLPDPQEGDYTIKVVGKLGRRSYLAVMNVYDKPVDKT